MKISTITTPFINGIKSIQNVSKKAIVNGKTFPTEDVDKFVKSSCIEDVDRFVKTSKTLEKAEGKKPYVKPNTKVVPMENDSQLLVASDGNHGHHYGRDDNPGHGHGYGHDRGDGYGDDISDWDD